MVWREVVEEEEEAPPLESSGDILNGFRRVNVAEGRSGEAAGGASIGFLVLEFRDVE